MSIPVSVTPYGNDIFTNAPCDQLLYVAGSEFCNCIATDNTCFQLAGDNEDETGDDGNEGKDSKLSGTMIAVITVSGIAVVSLVGVWLWRTYKPVTNLVGNTDTGSRM